MVHVSLNQGEGGKQTFSDITARTADNHDKSEGFLAGINR